MSSSFHFLSWELQGTEWPRDVVHAALGVVSRNAHVVNPQLARAIRERVHDASIVYVNRGSRPQYAIVRGIADPAGLRAGYVQPLEWIRWDVRRKAYVPLWGKDPAIVAGIARANDASGTMRSRDVGVLFASTLQQIVPMLNARRCNGGMYLTCHATAQKLEQLRGLETQLNKVKTGNRVTLNIIRGVGTDSARTAVMIVEARAIELHRSLWDCRTRAVHRYTRLRIKRRFAHLVNVWESVDRALRNVQTTVSILSTSRRIDAMLLMQQRVVDTL